MTLDLWPHQEKIVDFFGPRTHVIGDVDMGAGKTGATVFTASHLWNCRLVLIFAPKKVVESHEPWGKEFALGQFTDQEWKVVRLYKGGIPQRLKLLNEEGRAWKEAKGSYNLAFVINYETVLNAKIYDRLRSIPWCAVVLDEIHRIRGSSAKGSRKIHKICKKAKRVLGLTGTLMPHSPMDLWAIMRAVDDSVFGTSFVRFRNRYAKMGGFKGKQVVGYQNQKEMMDMCRNHIIRMTDDDMDLGLLPIVDEDVVLELCSAAAKTYKQLDETMMAHVAEGLVTASNALVKMLRLMQLTGGTQVVDVYDELGDRIDQLKTCVDTAKSDYIKEMCMDTDEKIVVFCLFHDDLDRIQEAAVAAGKTAMECSGRVNQLDEWVAGGAQVLAVQIGAGAEGINLTSARLAVFYSTGHSLGKYRQARKRLHRPGQELGVVFKHLIVGGSIDARIRKALAAREEVIESVLNQLREEVVCSA